MDLSPLVWGGHLSLNGGRPPRIPLDYVRIQFHRKRTNARLVLPLPSTFLAVVELVGQMVLRLNHEDSPAVFIQGPWQTIRTPFPIRRIYVTNEIIPGGGALLAVGMVEISPPTLPPTNPTRVQSGQVLVGRVPLTLPDVPVAPGCEAVLRADENNPGNVWVGSFPLAPGDALSVRVARLSALTVRADEGTSIVYWIAETI
ncbi:MAG: hypothetical protein QXD60_01160 [Nanopusillaceae archaeon]